MTVFGGTDPINVLIVGGGQGIGLGFVQHLLMGDRLLADWPPIGRIYATYRTPSANLEALVAQHPDRLGLIPMDVTDEAQIAQGIAQLQAQIGRLHLVVYCVGFLHEGEIQPEKSLQQLQADHLLRYSRSTALGRCCCETHSATAQTWRSQRIGQYFCKSGQHWR
jgi:Dehydrogenases with different specificities (related to short-chain alcohol dehydrogenases)